MQTPHAVCRAHPGLIPDDRRKKMLSLEMKLTWGRFDCYKSRNDYIFPPIWPRTSFNSSSWATVCRGPVHSAMHIYVPLCANDVPGSSWLYIYKLELLWCCRTPRAPWLFPQYLSACRKWGLNWNWFGQAAPLPGKQNGDTSKGASEFLVVSLSCFHVSM